jgi:hypothetical protein
MERIWLSLTLEHENKQATALEKFTTLGSDCVHVLTEPHREEPSVGDWRVLSHMLNPVSL